MNTYKVDYHNEDGDDWGAYVNAYEPRKAAELWLRWYRDENGFTGWGRDQQCEVQTLPAPLVRPGVVSWGDVPHCGFFLLDDLDAAVRPNLVRED
jgi:hypothetical protein